MNDRIDTSHFVSIAPPDMSATAPLPQTAPLVEEPTPAPAPDEHETRRLPTLTWSQQAGLAYRIWRDRVYRGGPWLAGGAALALAALIALLIFAPAGPAQAIVLARPTAPPVMMTATPSLVESLVIAAPPTSIPAPTEAPPAPVVVYYAPQVPTAPPVELQPAPAVVYVAQAEPTPSELTRIEPAGDGGQWIVEEIGGGRSISTYIPPPAPPGLAPEPPAPTPHFGEAGGGGGSWDD